MTNEERREWVKTLKEGDRVAALSSSHDRRCRGVVVKIMPSGMIKVKIYQTHVFTREGQSKVGRGWHCYTWTLDPWTSADQAELESDEAKAAAVAIEHAAEEERLNALPPIPGRVGAAFVKELERELAHARKDLAKAAESVKERGERVLQLLEHGKNQEYGSGLNRLGELQTLVSQFEGGCLLVSELEDLVRAARAHLLPKKDVTP